MDKKTLSERDICTQFIVTALQRAGGDFETQVREEVSFTKGRVIVRGKLHGRDETKQADGITRNTLSKMLNQHGARVRSENLDRLGAHFGCAREKLVEFVPESTAKGADA